MEGAFGQCTDFPNLIKNPDFSQTISCPTCNPGPGDIPGFPSTFPYPTQLSTIGSPEIEKARYWKFGI